jgi:beta-glucosidase
MEMLPDAMRDRLERIAGPKKGAEIKEQYCTALPVETAIAQSWNTDFAEMAADVLRQNGFVAEW